MSAVPAFFGDYQRRVGAELARLVPPGGSRVEQAMAYTALAPSKQVRAVLVLLCAELCRGAAERAVPGACAVELVHASSLVLDDLPAMDDAPLRRGRRANHLEFGEATAILAAFGLLNLAYGVLAASYAPALIAPHAAAATNSAPVLPRWIRSSISNVIVLSVASRSSAWPPISPDGPTAFEISPVICAASEAG